ncbi:long-chain N-acyl amino acid synthase [Pelomonas sp. KK5]|uniref:N-acyl amino acid synthase FeeM domain-containing protein n=1 Tax=Pelomonas sp. KK5 TaxID=1855730 RepID=UPI00118088C6|nr:long-chain N-acyl amino acid synthase [Pelomonas sp. KK5]
MALHEYPAVVPFLINSALSERHRVDASRLVHHRYVQRGYRREHPVGEREMNVLTLSATAEDGRTLGTLGIRFDLAEGLSADGAFPHEMEMLRGPHGREICEFTQLALDPQAASKQVLAALFHTAYLHAYRMQGIELLVIEVNPRHVPYYRRMLDFKICSEVRTNLHVHAPAVLMSLELAHAEQQIARLGGHPHMAHHVRSLYPWFFSPEREAAVLQLLHEEQRLAS